MEMDIKKVRSLLAYENRKHKWLAEECQVARSHISQVLAGQRRAGKPLIQLIAIKLGVPLEEIVLRREGRSAS